MRLTYAVCVCNESKDLYSLLSFLVRVKDTEDEVNILIDTAHVTPVVRKVVEHFEGRVTVCERDFDGKFATHRNWHFSQCSGDYIFYIDPDEMPQELLIQNLKNTITDTKADLICIPRINIHPGSTQEWLDQRNFKVNDMGWINWPDMQARIFRRCPEIRMSHELHERFKGAEKVIQVQPNPKLAMWHIKSIEKQDNRWDQDANYTMPDGTNLYDSLM